MEEFPKPIIVVSKCLGFDHCRYDGQIIDNPFVPKLKEFVDFRPVCPEMEIGLGVPREPIRIVEVDGQRRLYQPTTDRDVTAPMKTFVTSFLDSLQDVDGFLLKFRSPSCGLHDVKIYTGMDKDARTSKGSGFFGGDVLARFQDYPAEDEGRLRNFTIREHFFTTLFAFARFRAVKQRQRIGALVEFHSTHKLLLMGYHQTQMRQLGKIVANHAGHDFQTVVTDYEAGLKRAFAKIPRFTAMINVLLHAFGGFSEVLTKEEKQFFLRSIEEYRDERIPLSVLRHLLSAWAIKYNNTYLLQQTFMNPYPRPLVEITDSGKGRTLK